MSIRARRSEAGLIASRPPAIWRRATSARAPASYGRAPGRLLPSGCRSV